MAPKFGTSGLRGLVIELTDELCARYTRAFLQSTAHAGELVVAGDLRPSTRQHLAAVAAGARSLDVRVIDCGAVPTPALALEAKADENRSRWKSEPWTTSVSTSPTSSATTPR